MKLIPVSLEDIPLQQPLPFALRAGDGALLAKRGFVISNRGDLERMAGLRSGMFINEEDHPREFAKKLHSLLNSDVSLGEIASVRITANDLTHADDAKSKNVVGWLDRLAWANALLREPQKSSFRKLLEQLHADIRQSIQRSPDAAMLALIQLSATELRSYSALHAMLVCVMAELAAAQVLEWPDELTYIAGRVALTMNISMTALQDDLALQTAPLTSTQRQMIEVHAAYSVEVLKDLGITDATWLEAVLHHLDRTPGPLAQRRPALRIARLIQRANLFAAMMAPRASRDPLVSGVAMQACYYDENGAPDEAGAALIKVVGIYSPGTYVRLATQEVALVVRRGFNTAAPRVAVLINRQGLPTAEPIFRDTSQREYRIIATVAYRDMKVKLPLERLLAMV